MASSWREGLQITKTSYTEILRVMVLLGAHRCGIFLARWASDYRDILCRDTYNDGAPRSTQDVATSWHDGLQITQISSFNLGTYGDGAPRSKQMWQLPGTLGFRSHRYLMQRCNDAPSSKQMWHLPGMMGFRSHRYLMQRYLQ